jgi:hypothetical protein
MTVKMPITCPILAGLKSALKGRDIPAQGNALGYGSPHPNKALKGRDIAPRGIAPKLVQATMKGTSGIERNYVAPLQGLRLLGEPRPQGGAHL